MKPGYSLIQFKGDLFGGIIAGIVALPLALAFGVASGFGAAAGLYGAIAVGLFASLFGGTAVQVSGPTGPMTVIFAAAVAAFPAEPGAVLAVVMLAGILQIVFGLLKIGVFVRYIPYPVISGFMSGIGTIIILLQVHPLIGAPAVGSPLDAVLRLPAALSGLQPASLLLGSAAMLIVFLTPPRISRMVPSPLLALLFCTTLSIALELPVSVIGEIPSGLPHIHLPHFPAALFPHVATMALALAILGMIDSLLTSVVADSMTKTRHNSNRELFGQGLGNIASSLIGGLPGAGATMRTVVNIKTGGTTRVSGIIHALLLLAVLLGLSRFASFIPLPVLAGILMKVGVDILDYRLLRLINRIPRHDFAVMAAVYLITVFVDLIVAVGVGVTLASLMITWRIASQAKIDVGFHALSRGGNGNGESLEEQTDFQIRTITISGPFFFGTTAKMQDQVSSLAGTRVIVINCLNVPFMDLSGLFALSEMIDRLHHEHIRTILVTRDETGIRQQLEKMGYSRLIAPDGLRHDYQQALIQARSMLEETPPQPDRARHES